MIALVKSLVQKLISHAIAKAERRVYPENKRVSPDGVSTSQVQKGFVVDALLFPATGAVADRAALVRSLATGSS